MGGRPPLLLELAFQPFTGRILIYNYFFTLSSIRKTTGHVKNTKILKRGKYIIPPCSRIATEFRSLNKQKLRHNGKYIRRISAPPNYLHKKGIPDSKWTINIYLWWINKRFVRRLNNFTVLLKEDISIIGKRSPTFRFSIIYNLASWCFSFYAAPTPFVGA